jgi:hypothetical protein
MFCEKALDFAQHRRSIFLGGERVFGAWERYKPVRFPRMLQSGVHLLGLTDRRSQEGGAKDHRYPQTVR